MNETAKSPEQLLIEVTSILDDLGIRYFITGGFAVSVWGRPRATFDIDIVIQIIESQVDPLADALKAISSLGYLDEDSAREAVKSKKEFNFIDPESGLKVDFIVGPEDEFNLSKFDRRKVKNIESHKVYFISPEDLILSKLLWYKDSLSTRQLEDIESVVKISDDKLDWSYITKWADNLDVSDELGKIQK